MAGLLDFATTPAGQGLLAAAFGGLAGARRDAPLNSIGRAGLAGIAGYTGASAVQNQQLKLAREQKKLDSAEALTKALPGLYKPGENGGQQFDWQGAAALGATPEQIKAYGELPNIGRSEVSRTVDQMGPDGSKQVMQYDKYGQQVGQGIGGYVAPQLVDTGDRKQFVTPQAGQAFDVGMSPSEIAANNRGWAGVQARNDQNQVMRETNDITKQGQRTQIVSGADGINYLIDKGTGIAKPAQMDGGKPVMSGPAAAAAEKRERDSNDSVALISMVRDSLPGATGSGVGAAADSAGRYFGLTTESGKRASQLEALGGALVMKMPRMEGPQSDADTRLYREMAGKIGDRTVPVAEREASLKVVEQLLGRYATGAQNPKPAERGFDSEKEARYQAWKKSQGVN